MTKVCPRHSFQLVLSSVLCNNNVKWSFWNDYCLLKMLTMLYLVKRLWLLCVSWFANLSLRQASVSSFFIVLLGTPLGSRVGWSFSAFVGSNVTNEVNVGTADSCHIGHHLPHLWGWCSSSLPCQAPLCAAITRSWGSSCHLECSFSSLSRYAQYIPGG